jgi:hypothetical protein
MGLTDLVSVPGEIERLGTPGRQQCSHCLEILVTATIRVSRDDEPASRRVDDD